MAWQAKITRICCPILLLNIIHSSLLNDDETRIYVLTKDKKKEETYTVSHQVLEKDREKKKNVAQSAQEKAKIVFLNLAFLF